MFGKPIILVVILILLLAFYLVIRLGAGKKKDIEDSKNLTRYLSGVRILILILAIVGVILWLFLYAFGVNQFSKFNFFFVRLLKSFKLGITHSALKNI